MLFRTNTGSAFHFIAWLAIVAAAIQAWDIGQRVIAGLSASAAVSLSAACWWEDRALRRIRAQTEMLQRATRSVESFIGENATQANESIEDGPPKV